jgi:mono/diheme cytochrome c family protein
MPKFHLNDGEIRALVIFLKSRRGMNFAETEIQRYRAKLNEGIAAPPIGGAGTPANPIAFGEKLVTERACLACHKLGDKDGGIAPDLSWSGLMRDPKWLLDHFKDPRALVADSIMPSFRFPEAEFQALTAFLASRTAKPAAVSPADAYRTLCLRCHGEKGDGHGPIAIYLDPYPRDLTKAGFMNSKPLDRLARSIKEGVAGTSMPPWGRVLDDSQINGLLDYIQASFVREPRRDRKPLKAPDTNPVAFTAESAARGEATFVQRCAGCHGRKADGKGPNSLDILPRPRNLRNAAFVNSVSDRRLFESILYGVQGTAMPNWIDYGLSNNDVGDLVNFIRGIHTKPQGSPHARAN